MFEPDKIEVIRREDLEPGDIVFISCPEEHLKTAASWAEAVFKGYNVRIATMFNSMKIEVIRVGEEKCSSASVHST